MNRRAFLRSIGLGVGIGTAGCLGSENPDSPDSKDDRNRGESSTGIHTPTISREAIGQIDQNEVKELRFLGWGSNVIPEENLFQIQMFIRNVGDRTATITRYDLDTAVYDESGSQLESESHPANFAVNEIGPSDAVTVTTGRILENPETVARYIISLQCSSDNEGVYCER